jgi:tetratricopeptide (TPR) repeat protein
MKNFLYLALLVLLSFHFASSLQARYIGPDLEITPVDRLVKNLEAQVKAKPKDIRLRFNLARVHGMAFASKAGETSIWRGREDQGAWFGYEPKHVPFRLAKTDDPAKSKAAKAQLKLAIQRYKEVLKLDSKHLSANLGYGWCLQQAGKEEKAITQYRKTIEIGWAKEKEKHSVGPGWHSVVAEATGYLTPFLDPEKDKKELATLKQRIEHMKSIGRAITPIAVPLSDDLDVADLADLNARVPFDADGSGERGNWSWITRDAAWLVFDQKGDGQVTSGLQLFGSVTFWLFWNNGYEALATLDDNADDRLDGEELRHLALWRDSNGNGISEPGELTSLGKAGITSLSCRRQSHDSPHCKAFSPKGMTLRNGATRPTYDLILYPRK